MNPFPKNGWGGQPPQMGPGDQPKVQQAGMNHAYHVDIDTIERQQAIFANGQATHSKPPLANNFKLQEMEMAVKLRGKGDGVFTALNGLDAQFYERYPEDPEMARRCLASILQIVGIVHQDARTDLSAPLVTLVISGSIAQIAPGKYNIPGLETAEIQFTDAVVYDVPNLKNPIVGGNPANTHKIVMVPRPQTKKSISEGILRETAHILHDPANYTAAMNKFEQIANAKMHTAIALRNATLINGLMFLDVMLANGIVQFTPGSVKGATFDGVEQPEKVAQLAELLSLLHPGEHNVAEAGEFASRLSLADQGAWKKVEFDLFQRLLPLPNPATNRYNLRNEFGVITPEGGVPRATGRTETGEVMRTPVGHLLNKTLTATQHMIQALAVAIDEEKRNCAGWAMNTPNQDGTNYFQLALVPHGGLSAKGV
jgi:hypothetical protein